MFCGVPEASSIKARTQDQSAVEIPSTCGVERFLADDGLSGSSFVNKHFYYYY